MAFSLRKILRNQLNKFPKFRRLQFLISEKLLNYRVEKKNFKRRQGYELDLKNPKSFNQKIVWKKIYDRNPLLPIAADKHAVRDFIKEILGDEKANEILIPQLYVTDNPETIPFDDLPDEYVIKSNHGSNQIIIKRHDDKLDRNEVVKKCKEWLDKPFGIFNHQWAYQKIPRKIVIEKLIKNSKEQLPGDYRFHMFHGSCEFIQFELDKYTNHKRNLYDKNWNKLPVRFGYDIGYKVPKPDGLNKMIEIAKTLSEPFNYIRVDLYNVDGNIYFGELTNYPMAGYMRFEPVEFDFELGTKWRLEQDYWK